VAFGKRQRRTVRDHYVVATGAGAETGKYYMHYADYILSTGGTWSGSIGQAEVIISFAPSFFRPAKLIRVSISRESSRKK